MAFDDSTDEETIYASWKALNLVPDAQITYIEYLMATTPPPKLEEEDVFREVGVISKRKRKEGKSAQHHLG